VLFTQNIRVLFSCRRKYYLDLRLSLLSGLLEWIRFESESRLISPFPFTETSRDSGPGPRTGGGKHFGNLRFFVSGVLNVLSSHFDAARTLLTGFSFGKLIFRIWVFWFFLLLTCCCSCCCCWVLLLLLLLLLLFLNENVNDCRRFNFSSESFNVGMSSMLKIFRWILIWVK